MDKDGQYLMAYCRLNDWLLKRYILIPNNGAQCWYNSLIQLLISLPSFIQGICVIAQDKYHCLEGDMSNLREAPFLYFYLRLVTYLRDNIANTAANAKFYSLSKEVNDIVRKDFNNAFDALYSGTEIYDLEGQQDLSEILSQLLDNTDDFSLKSKFLTVHTRRFHCKCGTVKKNTTCSLIYNITGSDFQKMKEPSLWAERINKNDLSCEPIRCSSCSKDMVNKTSKERCKRRSEILLLQVNTNAKKDIIYNIPRMLTFIGDNKFTMDYKLITIVHHRADGDSAKSGHYWVDTIDYMDVKSKQFYQINDGTHKVIPNTDKLESDTAFILAYHLYDVLDNNGDNPYGL